MTTIDLSDPPVGRRRLGAFAIWTTFAVVYGAILYWQIGVPFPNALSSAMVYFYTLALLAIPVRRISQRLLSRPRPLAHHIAAQVAMGTAAITVWQGVHVLFHRVVVGPDFWALIYAGNWIFQLLSATVIYVAMVGVTLAMLAFARDRERVRREHTLALAARDAQLAALKAQFQPHFLLNALNSLLALVDRDPALARTMIVRLADLMKAVFEREGEPLVPLERELDLVRAYLDIERIRLGPRLSVIFDIEDAARGVLVPPFLLQPVVENAVKHGVAPFARPGSVHVSATVAGSRLRVVVRDSGGGPVAAASTHGTGRGLQIARSHLSGAYGDGKYQLTLVPGKPGTAVEIEVPAEPSNVA